jgi:hypothetical protein
MASKWEFLEGDFRSFYQTDKSPTSIARKLYEKHKAYILSQDHLPKSIEAIRKWAQSFIETETLKADHAALSQECEDVGIPIEAVNHYWHKGKRLSIHAKNNAPTYWDLRDEIIDDMKAYAPSYPKIKFDTKKDGCLLVIDPADIHIGKLCSIFETGDKYDAEIACKLVLDGVKGLIQKSSGVHIDKILFITGNDILHVDTPRNTTTSGTHQDTHLMWYDAFRVAKKLLIDVFELLIPIAPIDVHYNPSNHDFTNGFFLIDSISSWFSKVDSVNFSASMAHRKYYQYHKNLIGTTHGDGAKKEDLALLMAHEAAEYWNDSKHRYFYMHHIHHKYSKDFMSVCVEALRSPSGTDGWHHRNGYQHAPKAVEAYIHGKEHGQIARLTHIF